MKGAALSGWQIALLVKFVNEELKKHTKLEGVLRSRGKASVPAHVHWDASPCEVGVMFTTKVPSLVTCWRCFRKMPREAVEIARAAAKEVP
jgi:hypothetical protein